jgi:hypothetical protein
MKLKDNNSEQLVRFHDRGHFQKNLLDEIIGAMEAGMPRSAIVFVMGSGEVRYVIGCGIMAQLLIRQSKQVNI